MLSPSTTLTPNSTRRLPLLGDEGVSVPAEVDCEPEGVAELEAGEGFKDRPVESCQSTKILAVLRSVPSGSTNSRRRGPSEPSLKEMLLWFGK